MPGKKPLRRMLFRQRERAGASVASVSADDWSPMLAPPQPSSPQPQPQPQPQPPTLQQTMLQSSNKRSPTPPQPQHSLSLLSTTSLSAGGSRGLANRDRSWNNTADGADYSDEDEEEGGGEGGGGGGQCNAEQRDRLAKCQKSLDQLEFSLNNLMLSLSLAEGGRGGPEGSRRKMAAADRFLTDLVDSVRANRTSLRRRRRLQPDKTARRRHLDEDPACERRRKRLADESRALWRAQHIGARCEDTVDRYMLDVVVGRLGEMADEEVEEDAGGRQRRSNRRRPPQSDMPSCGKCGGRLKSVGGGGGGGNDGRKSGGSEGENNFEAETSSGGSEGRGESGVNRHNSCSTLALSPATEQRVEHRRRRAFSAAGPPAAAAVAATNNKSCDYDDDDDTACDFRVPRPSFGFPPPQSRARPNLGLPAGQTRGGNSVVGGGRPQSGGDDKSNEGGKSRRGRQQQKSESVEQRRRGSLLQSQDRWSLRTWQPAAACANANGSNNHNSSGLPETLSLARTPAQADSLGLSPHHPDRLPASSNGSNSADPAGRRKNTDLAASVAAYRRDSRRYATALRVADYLRDLCREFYRTACSSRAPPAAQALESALDSLRQLVAMRNRVLALAVRCTGCAALCPAERHSSEAICRLRGLLSLACDTKPGCGDGGGRLDVTRALADADTRPDRCRLLHRLRRLATQSDGPDADYKRLLNALASLTELGNCARNYTAHRHRMCGTAPPIRGALRGITREDMRALAIDLATEEKEAGGGFKASCRQRRQRGRRAASPLTEALHNPEEMRRRLHMHQFATGASLAAKADEGFPNY